MKVVIVGTAYPYRGGLSAFNERLAVEYQQQGHDVEIYTFTVQYPSILFPGKTQYSTEPAPKGLKILRKVNSCNPLNWVKVGREIRRKTPDVLLTKYWLPFMAPCLGTIERIVRRNGKTHVVAILDNVIPHEHRIGDRLFSRYFVKSTACFVAMSRSVLSDLETFTTSKPRLFCPHPLYDHYGDIRPDSEAKQALGLAPDMRYVLFFGFIRSYKGLDLLLRAFAESQVAELNDVRLLVAGEFYGEAQPYLDIIASLGLENRVILRTEFIPDSRVRDYFCASDLVAQPYKSATQSGVTQIAYHFERPMLVTRVGGLPEMVPEGRVGYVVAPEVKTIAEAIADFFTHDRYASMAEGVREEKKKYSWRSMTDAIKQLTDER